jgi:hypothetical protein
MDDFGLNFYIDIRVLKICYYNFLNFFIVNKLVIIHKKMAIDQIRKLKIKKKSFT